MSENISAALGSELAKMSLSDLKTLKDELIEAMRRIQERQSSRYKERGALLETVNKEMADRITYLLAIRDEETGE